VQLSPHQRDLALARLRRTRWFAAGLAAVGAGILSVWSAQSFPGHQTASVASAAVPGTATGTSSGSDGVYGYSGTYAGSTGGSFAPTSGPAQVISGAS
jgi:hypothetical protein